MADRLQDSLTTRYDIRGELKLNNAVPSSKAIRCICSYVCQDEEALFPHLTVHENLQIAAALRLLVHLSKTKKRQSAESLLLKTGLRDCADNLVGSDLINGTCGGEKRRRVTVAIQTSTYPQILLLDEPTSVLGAFTASSIMTVLRGLAKKEEPLPSISIAHALVLSHFSNVILLA
ncbi:MAG: hypothetical protein Q9213_006574 [Squamulea squamosa]